jgi:hypothetical protein
MRGWRNISQHYVVSLGGAYNVIRSDFGLRSRRWAFAATWPNPLNGSAKRRLRNCFPSKKDDGFRRILQDYNSEKSKSCVLLSIRLGKEFMRL